MTLPRGCQLLVGVTAAVADDCFSVYVNVSLSFRYGRWTSSVVGS